MTAESSTTATIDQISPDELLMGFSKSHLVRWLLVAVLLHAAVIAVFSVGTIRDWLDPEGAKARIEAAQTAAAAEPAAVTPAESQPPKAVEVASADTPPVTDAAGSEAKTPIEKATTEVAEPGEIPTVPDDLGLSIEDTNLN